ncbi:hypothetical protein POM88_011984 [Heracleum sosnowskyi]|uniref:Reverse transcriptase Ty1/copia-type domain-containing protein n=1 Tax=Heracleum sosnowskyi TaxID=360622 RepID=A0AAD8N2Y8_9APIA|nr:hypothetical protein POM88_011984 [Heracleum sosnowskyi]
MGIQEQARRGWHFYKEQGKTGCTRELLDFVYFLFKAIYGLKQAPRKWYDTLSGFLLENGFVRGIIDKTLFSKKHKGDMILVQVYVDNIIFGSTNDELCKRFAKLMLSKFEMSMMGELKFFLGLQVSQRSNGIFICQSKYLKELLKKYHMEDSASARTPSSTAIKLGASDNSIKVDVTSYRGMIGSLLYLTASRPDIMYATCLCARFQADPRDLHLVAVKRILRYIKGTPNLGIWYPKDSGFNLVGYTDSDYAGSVVDRKSTSGSCQFLGGRLISWYSKKQQTVSNSTAEAEYIASGSCCAQILWIRNQLKDYGFALDKIPILCDNTSAIAISNNPVQHSRTKHIDIRYHFIKEHVMNGTVELHFVPTEEQTADIFTKSVDESTFTRPWISFLNQHSCVNYAICSNVDLKVDPLYLLCSTAVVSDDFSTISFNIQDTQYIITEETFCNALQFPRDNFDRLPTEEELTRLNFGHLLWEIVVRRVFNARKEFDNGRKIKCFYPRFLSLVLNSLLSNEHQELFRNGRFFISPTTDRKFYHRLQTSFRYSNVPVLISNYMTNFINLPSFEPPVPEQRIVTSTGTEEVIQPQVRTSIPGSSGTVSETQEVDRADQEFVEPQTLSPIIEPNTESYPNQPEPYLYTRNRNSSDEETMSDPAALSPPLKKRRTYREISVSPSVSSQQDMDFEMANTQSLETSYQQGESIEVRHRAMAFCTESSTLPLLTMGENITLDATQDTLLGEHLGHETVPTIVTVEVPLQASEGKFDSLPTQIESFSPLPEGTSLAPLRDFPLAVFTGESGRQPIESNTEAIQFQIPDDLLDFFRDWESRTPIAPPLTSQEGARVIFPAGTSTPNMDRQLVVRSERQTQSDTQAREQSETPSREIEMSAHNDTYTASLLAQIAGLQKQLQQTQAEKYILKAQVVERSSSSTSVTNQLGTIKDEIEGLKTTLVPMMNAIQESQVLVASDISEFITSNTEIIESVKQIASISTRVDYIQETVDENQWFNDERFARIEGGMQHLNEDMKHLYNMIKNSHQPNAEQKKFFDGDDDDKDNDEDSSTKGENKEKEKQGGEGVRDQGGEAQGSGSGKDKGKQKLTFSDDVYYQDEHGEFDDIESEETPEDIFGEVEKADLKRRDKENAKVSDIISKHLVIQKAEHQEKQRFHDIKVKDKKLYVRLKLGEEWDRAREMFSHPTGSDNDGKFFSMLERYRKVNPDNTIYMKALHAEISRITTGYDRVREELKIYIYTHNEGTFLVSLNLPEGRTLSELWVFMTKIKRSSPLCELLHDQLREFAMKASPQVLDVPYEVKFYKGRALQTCGVDPISLKDYPAKHLVYMENMLRTTGFATQEKTEVADLIQDYCIANIKRYHQMKNRLKKVTTQPVRPSDITSESDRVLDKDLLEALEEGEMMDEEI